MLDRQRDECPGIVTKVQNENGVFYYDVEYYVTVFVRRVPQGDGKMKTITKTKDTRVKQEWIRLQSATERAVLLVPLTMQHLVERRCHQSVPTATPIAVGTTNSTDNDTSTNIASSASTVLEMVG